jgi:carbonic anhydrase
MTPLTDLLANNRRWAAAITQDKPDFFPTLARQQAPKYLWVGCSDSRVPANEIVGLLPGELFVHRNVANLVLHADLNCLSVLQYAVDVLRVEHVIVCGHYGCGGVLAALEGKSLGLIDNWIRNITDVRHRHRQELDALGSERQRFDRLCELNVIAQVANLAHTTVAQDAWRRGQSLTVRGWIYGLQDGLLKDLDVCIESLEQVADSYQLA